MCSSSGCGQTYGQKALLSQARQTLPAAIEKCFPLSFRWVYDTFERAVNQVVSEKQAYLCLTRYRQRKSLTAQRDWLSFAALVSDKRRFNFFIKQKSILLRSSERITVYFAFPVIPQLFQIKFRKIDLFRSIRL